MMYWDDSLSTGVEIVDEDHKTLFGLINNVRTASENVNEGWRIGIAIDALNDYAEQHFRREEALLLLCGYSALERHETEHSDFHKVVVSLKHIYSACPQMVSVNGVISFLEDWLQIHIAVSDRAYVEQMHAHKSLIDAASRNFLKNIGALI